MEWRSHGVMAAIPNPTLQNTITPILQLVNSMATRIEQWVNEVAALTKPDNIHWCDGSVAENAKLVEQMLASGTLQKLNEKEYPGCYLHRSNINDVARTEHLTFICTKTREAVGPTN